MSADRTYGDELADVFASFAVEKNSTGLSVGIDSAYELGDHIESDWLTEHDRQVAERAWAEGQSRIDAHIQKIAHRVMDVFEATDEDTLADEIMSDVFAAIGLFEAFGAAKGEQK